MWDEYYPADRATTTVVINVDRNPSGPRFIEGVSYNITIGENHPYGSLVIDLNATDADGVSKPTVFICLNMFKYCNM